MTTHTTRRVTLAVSASIIAAAAIAATVTISSPAHAPTQSSSAPSHASHSSAPVPTSTAPITHSLTPVAPPPAPITHSLTPVAPPPATWYPPYLPPCAVEDGDNCYWDALAFGNGEGRSFYVENGVVTYVDR